MITLKEIHEKIKESIVYSGMKQSELAEKINVSQSAIAHYKKGDKYPALDTLANLCKELDLDANEILCITKN